MSLFCPLRSPTGNDTQQHRAHLDIFWLDLGLSGPLASKDKSCLRRRVNNLGCGKESAEVSLTQVMELQNREVCRKQRARTYGSIQRPFLVANTGAISVLKPRLDYTRLVVLSSTLQSDVRLCSLPVSHPLEYTFCKSGASKVTCPKHVGPHQ